MKTQFIEKKAVQDKRKTLKKSGQIKTNIGLDPALLDLVMLRIAQLHQSQIGVETHWLDLRDQRESAERLEQLEMWRESFLFNDRERMALAWGEALSLNPTRTILKQLLEMTKCHFNKEQIISLTLAIMAVIDWNYQ